MEGAQPWKPDGQHYVWDLSNIQYLLLELKSHFVSKKYFKNLMYKTVTDRPMIASSTKRDDIKVSLMEMEAQVHQKVSQCVGEECDPAMQAAWVLHKLAFDIDCANYKVFDVEQRTPLAAYREGLKKLIKSREEKLKALDAQAESLRASLADPGQTLAELLPLINKHVQIQDVACKKMPLNTEKMLKELKAIQSDIAHGTFDCSI